MAKNPIAEVKQAWRDALAELPEFAGVNLHAGWPGEDLLYADTLPAVDNYKAAIWFGLAVCDYALHSMRADRQRRIVTATFPVWIEVQVMGESNDQNNAGMIASVRAEQIAYDLWQPIDEHVADDKHLSCPDLVTSAVVGGDESPTAGFTDTGYGVRLGMPVSATFRLL